MLFPPECTRTQNLKNVAGTLRRYSALKSLGEKKACFNEYQQQRKNEEIAEKRQRLKKAREDFTTMLEEAPDLRASTRYSAAQALLEDDPRWKVCPHLGCFLDGRCCSC